MESESKDILSNIINNEDIFFPADIKIGPFIIQNEIGNGKFSTVYLGLHSETKEKVAIKKITKSKINTDNLLIKEISIMKILFHPYIIKMYCVIENPENIFIISEYCSKGDLITNLMENGAFDEYNACKIFQQILSALEYLHKNNICHRDIKPENILLNSEGEAKLSDFGLSKFFNNNEFLNTFCGSPIYAAPEMLQGKEYDGIKIDIWCLGISLYTMVAGELPFFVENEKDIQILIDKIIKGQYEIPDFLSDECKDLIKKMMQINPEKRINLEEIKRHKWVNMFNINYMKSPGVIIDKYFLPIDIEIIKDICGNDKEKIKILINDVLNNKHNDNTVRYYLYCNIKTKNGKKSVCDLRPNSDMFLEYIKSEKSMKKYWDNDINKIGENYLIQTLDIINKEKNMQQDNILENKLDKKDKFEYYNIYKEIFFIHNIIDDIINKVVLFKDKNILDKNKYLIASSTKIEIKNNENKSSEKRIKVNRISKENTIYIQSDKMNSNKQKLFINKINNIQINPFNFEGNEYHKKIQSKIIKNIDLGTKSLLSSSKKNMSNCDIKHLQINIIENEIIINNTHLKKNGNNDIRLTQNLSHNSSIKINSDNKKINKGKNNKLSKTHIKNKSVDIISKKMNYFNENRESKRIKRSIIIPCYKKIKSPLKFNFIKSPLDKNKTKSSINTYSSILSFNSPTSIKKVNNILMHKKFSFSKFDNIIKNINISKIPTNKNSNKKMITFIKYKNTYQESKSKSNSKNKLSSILSPKSKLEIKNKKIKEDNFIIKTNLSFDKIRQIIKNYVGNNVVENNESKNFKFICKTKVGKDEIIFNLELIDTNFDTQVFKGNLIQGETRLYKESLLKIKEKLS